jgi:hypothetical protein
MWWHNPVSCAAPDNSSGSNVALLKRFDCCLAHWEWQARASSWRELLNWHCVLVKVALSMPLGCCIPCKPCTGCACNLGWKVRLEAVYAVEVFVGFECCIHPFVLPNVGVGPASKSDS